MIAAAFAHVHPVAAVVIHHGVRLAARQFMSWLAAVASRRPSVTVVTPTWLRRRLLTCRCMPSVQAQVRAGADFAYSRAMCHGSGMSWSIGQAPPAFGQVDTSLIVHRRELLDVATWEPSQGPADWDLVSRWIRHGASWAYAPDVTMDYYHPAEDADHGHAAR